MTDPVLFDARADGIAIITINRPEQRNCLNREVREGLFAALERFENDPACRIAILTGAGEKAFCAGGDLKEMVDTGMTVPPPDFLPFVHDNVRLTKPTIAAVNGFAFAGGWASRRTAICASPAPMPNSPSPRSRSVAVRRGPRR